MRAQTGMESDSRDVRDGDVQVVVPVTEEHESDSAVTEWEQRAIDRAARSEEVQRRARSVYAAVAGWGEVQTQEDWDRIAGEALDQYEGGQFLIEQMGAERLIEPRMMAVLQVLRDGLVRDLGPVSTHELMLIDAAVLAYRHLLRFNTLVGNVASGAEWRFFGVDGPEVKVKRRYGREVAAKLSVEDDLHRLGEQVLPLMDRSQKMMVRALKAIQELRQSARPSVASPSVSIGSAGQVNVAGVQTNVAPSEILNRELSS